MNCETAEKQHEISFRKALEPDIEDLKMLIFEHGPNQWNHLPKDEVEKHLDEISSGETQAIVALDNGRIVGMATFNIGNFYSEYESEAGLRKPRGYIAEAVVNKTYAGKGIGTALLEQAIKNLRTAQIETIYAKRHEENAASAGIMRKAGFVEVDTFSDPIRTSGSGKTTVERFRLIPKN